MSQALAVGITAVGSLLGVVIGATITAVSDRNQSTRSRDVKSREDRRESYVQLLTAARQMRRHLQTEAITVKLIQRPGTTDSTPVLESGSNIWLPFEAALARVQLMTASQSIHSAADQLRSSRYLLIRSRATFPAGGIPQATLDEARESERTFSQAAIKDIEGN